MKKLNPNKMITMGSIIIFLFSLCLMPVSCNPKKYIDDPNAVIQETLLVVEPMR